MLFYYRNHVYCCYRGSSYAYTVSDFNTNLQTIVSNAPTSQNNMKSAINVMLNNNANYNNNITTIGMENYNYVLASYVIYNSSTSYFDIIMTNDPIEINIQDYYVTFTTIPTNYVVYRFAIVKFSGQFGGVRYDGNVTSNVTITNTYFRRMPTDNTTRNLLVFNVYNLNNPNDLEYLGNWSPPLYFFINENTNSNTHYVDIEVDTGNTLEDIPIIYTNNFGTLEDNKYIYYINDVLGFWYYNGSSWTYKQIYNRSKDMVLLINNRYMNFSYFNDNEEADLTLSDLITYTNVVYYYNVTNAYFESARAYFIIGDSNTSITNNTIDTSSLPGNYNQQWKDLDNIINNNDNTQEIIDNVNDDSQVDNILNSISSGDDIESLAHNLGIVTIENPFTDIVFGIFNGAIDSLTASGDVSLNFGFHGHDIYIKSSDFSTPSNLITEFIGLILDALYIYALYWYYFMIIESIKNFTFYQDIVNANKWAVTSDSSGGLSWRLL